MFNEFICNTAFSTPEVSNYFQNNMYFDCKENYDETFKATLYALIGNKLKDEHACIGLYERILPHRSSGYSKVELIHAAVYRSGNAISIVNVDRDVDCVFNLLETGWKDAFKDYIMISKVTDFFKKSFRVFCLVNPEIKNSILFVEKLNLKKWHYLQCAIFAFLPWYFDKETGITEDEMALIKSLEGNSAAEYLKALENIAAKFDFRNDFIKSQLKGFETMYIEQMIQSIENQIRSLDGEIQNYREAISARLVSKDDYMLKLTGAREKAESNGDKSEVMDYFIANKDLHLVSFYNNIMAFFVTNYAEFFDEDMASKVIKNKNSVLYGGCRSNEEVSNMKSLMTAVFLEQKIKLRLCAAYSMDPSRYVVNAVPSYAFPDSVLRRNFPNTHIQQYRCLGNYVLELNDAMAKNDYVYALSLCCASCSSLNFGDSVVISNFGASIVSLIRSKDTYYKFFELPDGTNVSAIEAIEWLAKEMENTNE